MHFSVDGVYHLDEFSFVLTREGTAADYVEYVGESPHQSLPVGTLSHELQDFIQLARYLLIQLALLTFIHN